MSVLIILLTVLITIAYGVLSAKLFKKNPDSKWRYMIGYAIITIGLCSILMPFGGANKPIPTLITIQNSDASTNNTTKVLDTKTGMEYISRANRNGSISMSPILNKDNKPLVLTKDEINEQITDIGTDDIKFAFTNVSNWNIFNPNGIIKQQNI